MPDYKFPGIGGSPNLPRVDTGRNPTGQANLPSIDVGQDRPKDLEVVIEYAAPPPPKSSDTPLRTGGTPPVDVGKKAGNEAGLVDEHDSPVAGTGTTTPKVEPETDVRTQPDGKRLQSVDHEIWKAAVRYQFIYSMGGLFLGFSCIVGGLILFLRGVSGATSWTASLLGIKSDITDAAPGAVLFIVGIFLVRITKFSVRGKGIPTGQ